MFSFYDLEMKFGAPAAYQFLLEIEKAANIRSRERANVDPETRLVLACRAQDEMRANLRHAA